MGKTIGDRLTPRRRLRGWLRRSTSKPSDSPSSIDCLTTPCSKTQLKQFNSLVRRNPLCSSMGHFTRGAPPESNINASHSRRGNNCSSTCTVEHAGTTWPHNPSSAKHSDKASIGLHAWPTLNRLSGLVKAASTTCCKLTCRLKPYKPYPLPSRSWFGDWIWSSPSRRCFGGFTHLL